MSSQKLGIFTLVLFCFLSLSFSINLSQYLYSNERPSQLVYTNFTYLDENFSIVSIGSNNLFLLSSDNLTLNSSKIDEALKNYYFKNYYPSDSDLSDLRNLIIAFNRSRNDGGEGYLAGKEEYVCRDDVLVSNGKVKVLGTPLRCTDNTSCIRISQMLFGVWSESGLQLGSPQFIYNNLVEFTPYSIKMDDALGLMLGRLDSLSENNVYDNLEFIRNTSDNLTLYSAKVESTLFRSPRLSDPADRSACYGACFGVCPPMDLNQSLIVLIKKSASNLSNKSRPIQQYRSVSSTLFQNTLARISFNHNETTAKVYLDIYQSLNQSIRSSVALGTAASSVVSNSTLSSKLDRMLYLNRTVLSQIALRNFSNLDLYLPEIRELSKSISNDSTNLLSQYNSTLTRMNEANRLLLLLESRDTDPVLSLQSNSIKNRTLSLNNNFRSGLASAQLTYLGQQYTEIINESSVLLATDTQVPVSGFASAFRSFTKNVNYQLANAIKIIPNLSTVDFIANHNYYFGLLSFSVFLCISSLLFLIFFYLGSSVKQQLSPLRRIFFFSFFSILALVCVFSVLFYSFLQKTSFDATLPEYAADFNRFNSTSIVLDLRNTSDSQSLALQNCASSLAASIGLKNKSTSTYLFGSSSCTVADSNLNYSLSNSACVRSLANKSSVIYLSSSPSSVLPVFYIGYQNRLQLSATENYFRTCPISSIFE
ncbi:hypothetical protein HY990_01525 [Candidatus Micrarchaeota archaeon]|nr:hypothetical protein [Candidatus Micrarchaeota archaeon]